MCSYLSCTFFGAASGFEGGSMGDGDFEGPAYDLLDFFGGGASEAGAVEGGERFAAAREACVTGSWMPSDGSDSDLRRVLYGMVCVCLSIADLSIAAKVGFIGVEKGGECMRHA